MTKVIQHTLPLFIHPGALAVLLSGKVHSNMVIPEMYPGALAASLSGKVHSNMVLPVMYPGALSITLSSNIDNSASVNLLWRTSQAAAAHIDV